MMITSAGLYVCFQIESKQAGRKGAELYVVIRTETMQQAFETANLVRSPAGEYGGDGLQENLEIQPHRPVVDVKQIKFNPAIEFQAATSFERPQAGQAGSNAQTAALPALVLLDFMGQRWAWPDQRHVSAQDVPKLRQLVQAEHSHRAAYGCTPRIVAHLEYGTVNFIQSFQMWKHFVRIVNHGAEFEQGEFASAEPAPRLPVEDPAWRGQFDKHSQDEKQGRKQGQGNCGDHKIDDSFEKQGELVLR